MADNEATPTPGPDVLTPYFVVERPSEGGAVAIFTNSKYKRESVRAMFAMVELNDLDRTTLWRTVGSRGQMVELIARAFMNNPGLTDAVGSMMVLLVNDERRKEEE